jgi:hypothetical protein
MMADTKRAELVIAIDALISGKCYTCAVDAFHNL